MVYRQQHGIHICQRCDPPRIFNNANSLGTHHSNLHVSTRTQTNFALLTEQLYNNSAASHSYDNHWVDGLKWLQQHNQEPPPFRTSLLKCIKFQLEEPIDKLLEDIMEVCVLLKQSPTDNSLRTNIDFQHDHVAGQLPYLFEQLVLAPTLKPPAKLKQQHGHKFNQSLTKLIHHRINLFRSGQLDTLYKDSRSVVSKTQTEMRTLTTSQIQQNAQDAADENNYKSAVARAIKDTPVALNNERNIQILNDLHPPKLPYEPSIPQRSTRSQQAGSNNITITPSDIVSTFQRLQKGKAAGIQCDSTDIYIRLLRKRLPHDSKLAAKSKIAKLYADFFTLIASGTYGKIERSYNNTIYLVALHKDTANLEKLRPIGVPTAIRRITAALLISKNKSDFTSHLLPFNYALGVHGGINTVVNTFRNGTYKYITQPQQKSKRPTRALISLDIRNMFNAVSRHKLREIIATDFPHLQPIADSLYATTHYAKYKNLDGEWETIEVAEGFTQGCPFSPLFAGLVLTHILRKINAELLLRAADRKRIGIYLDDDNGGEPIIMAYVDDTNCLLPIEDVEFFLDQFKHYGEPLGAVMNTDKTRILTSTNGSTTIPLHLAHNRELGTSLSNAIMKYSRNGDEMHEETNGLRILGSPVGSSRFQHDFINKYMQDARSDANKLISSLNDSQTILQLYRSCTAHRLTHLFTADVYATETHHQLSTGPTLNEASNWHHWTSKLSLDFDEMNTHVISELTKVDNIPQTSSILMNISTKHGGLNLPAPRTTAVSSYVLSYKQTLQTINEGVYTSPHKPRTKLPRSIVSLYQSTTNFTPPATSIFEKYAPELARICHPTRSTRDRLTSFIHHTSVNTCRERIATSLAQRLTQSFKTIVDDDSVHNVEEILHNRLGIGLLDLDRSTPKNRQPNSLFNYNLRRCLRLNLWDTDGDLTCPMCKNPCDKKGDHLYQCIHFTRKHETRMHHLWRDCWKEVLGKIDKVIHISDKKPNHESQGHVASLVGSDIRPFDVDLQVTNYNRRSTITCPLNTLGFDIVTTNAGTYVPPAQHNSAKRKTITTLLQEQEKHKFQRGNGKSNSRTNPANQVTLSGEEITDALYKSNKQLIPFAISPNGLFGPVINRFLYGTAATIPNIDPKKFPAAHRMAERSISTKVPSGILLLADATWKNQHPQTLYGGSWKCPLPSSYAEQEFSRTTCFANGSYGLDAIQQMNRQPIIDEPSRIRKTNTSDPTPHVTPMDNSESGLTDVSHLLFDNGQTTFSPDSLLGR